MPVLISAMGFLLVLTLGIVTVADEQSTKMRPNGNDAQQVKVQNDDILIRKLGYPYYTGEIIPKPKDVKYGRDFICLVDFSEGRNQTCLLLGKDASKQAKAAAKKLQARLNAVLRSGGMAEDIKILKENDDYSSFRSVISIGSPFENKVNAEYLSREKIKITKDYPGKEGYVFLVADKKEGKIVICAGSDGRGSYYAVQSLNQLITVKDNKILLRKARITDWPTSFNRATAEGSVGHPLVADWMGAYKINNFIVGYRGTRPWNSPRLACIRGNLDMSRYANKTEIFEVSYLINPYCISDDSEKKIKISDDRDITALIDHYRKFLEVGGRKIVLTNDDSVPVKNLEFVLPHAEDKVKFGGLAAAHIYLANTIYNTLSKEYPDLEMYFCPTYYCTGHVAWARKPEIAKDYLLKIGKGLSPEIKVVFTGPSILSPVITEKDIEEIRSFFGGRDWYLWDNTIGLYSSARCCENVEGGIYKPFTTTYPSGFGKYIFFHNNSVCNWTPAEEAQKIYAISVCDYMWNPEAYNAETSLRQAIESYIGPGMADLLIEFGRLYDSVKKKSILRDCAIESGKETAYQKVILEERFEGKGLGPKDGAFAWHHFSSDMNVHLEKADAPDGNQCVVSTAKDKGFILRTSNFAVDIPMEDFVNGAVEFYWKTSDPDTCLGVRLEERKAMGEGAHGIDVKATDTDWHLYCIPFFKFVKDKNVKTIGGIRFWRGVSGKDATFKIDRVRLLLLPPLFSEKEGKNRQEALQSLHLCFKKITEKCLNKRLLEFMEEIIKNQAKH